MQAPLPFIIEKEGKLLLNEEVMSIIEKSTNPKFISFYGSTRGGKSTTLNQIISSNKESRSYVNKEPFKTGSAVTSVTSGCDIYGPIKFSELKKKHPLSGQNKSLKEDFDIFFCDTEGIDSLNDFNKSSIPGILIILQICTMSVFMVHKNCKEPDFKEICSLMQFSKILNKELKVFPRVGVYISDMLPGDDVMDNEDNEEIDLDDYNAIKDMYKDCYKNSIDEQKKIILDKAQQRYPDLSFKAKDVEIIAGGPYINEKDPKRDLKLEFYWCSIHEIFDTFVKFYREEKKEKKNAENNNGVNLDIIKLIRTLFEIFSEIDKLDDDFNLRNFLISYLEKKFDTHSKKQFEIKLEKIKEDIKTNFLEYISILNDDEKAKESLGDCFQKELLEIYKQLIPKKIENFIKLSLEQYRKFIKEQIEAQFNSISDNILSPDNLELLIKDVKEMIINAEFREDIDMNKVNNIEGFWEGIYEQNQVILNYYKETKQNLFNNLKENFISKINDIFQQLLSKKIIWADYLKDSLISIQKQINQIYSESFKKCNYQEDIETYIQDSSNLFNAIFPQIQEKYFNKLSQERLKIVQENVKQICDEEYNKILENKLPLWSKLKEDITSRINENINSYFIKVFKGVQFKDQVDPNMGRKDIILNQIPLDIQNNPQIKGNKKEEIKQLIEYEVDNALKMFNEKRDSLSLFSDYANNIIKVCNEIADKKMQEILGTFNYLEDKPIFNSDYIFTLLTKDQSIYKNCSSKIEDINIKLRELCNDKSREYDLAVKRAKPEWAKIKSDKINNINEICNEYIRKIFSNAEFQDDIKKVDIEQLKKKITESKGFYDGVQDNKKKELNNELDKILSQIEDKISARKGSLQNWESIKTQLLQRAYIEMVNKSKTNLDSKDHNKIIELLVTHIHTIPRFFDLCKTEQRKQELISELRHQAAPIATDYINRVNAEEKRRKEEEERERNYRRQLQIEAEKRKEAEKRAEAERQKREQEERRRREEENRRRQEEENRRRQEEENRRRQEEENRRRQEHRNHIEDLARRAIRGDFGNGQARRNALGGEYNEVQNRVNEILGYSKRY